jgi:dihydroorotase
MNRIGDQMPDETEYDVAIECGRIFDPQTDLDCPGILLIRDGRIAKVIRETDRELSSSKLGSLLVKTTIKHPHKMLLPGLIDMHAHPAVRGSVFGTAPDATMLPRGVTAVLSQGDAGADNIDDYIKSTVLASTTTVRLAINISRIGESTTTGCCDNEADVNIDACVKAINRHSEFVPAIAANLSQHACGRTDPRIVLDRALETAKQSGLPILFGMRCPKDWPLADQLRHFRAGDIVTYCFRQEPHCIVENGRVLKCVVEAQQRGVNFDVGHGTTSFSFAVAQAAIADGFLPNTISTDHQARHLAQSPTHDLPLVMSKLLAAGMQERDIFAAVTLTPSRLINFGEPTGNLAVGTPARFTLLDYSEQSTLTDALGEQRMGLLWQAESSIHSTL